MNYLHASILMQSVYSQLSLYYLYFNRFLLNTLSWMQNTSDELTLHVRRGTDRSIIDNALVNEWRGRLLA